MEVKALRLSSKCSGKYWYAFSFTCSVLSMYFTQTYEPTYSLFDHNELCTLGEGFAIFFRLSLGGVAIGIASAMGLVVVLYSLDQRLNTENNVVQVAATVTVAYLTFFVSEIAAGCSGVLAVVVCCNLLWLLHVSIPPHISGTLET